MKRITLILLFSGLINLQAQIVNDARKIIDTLTSPYMNGRGYVGEGVEHAANYIRSEFELAGLKKFNNTYNQHFKLNINTFPDTISLKVKETVLVAGKDFIVEAGSAPARGKYKLIPIDSNFIQSESKIKKFYAHENKDAFLLVNKETFGLKNFELLLAYLKQTNGLNTAGLIELVNTKLTMDIAQEQNQFTHLIVSQTEFPSDAATVEMVIESELKKYYKTENIIGLAEGTNTDSFLVLTAHYDHLGQLGNGVYFPGANDNASGIAMLIELARYFANPENKPAYSILFIAFAGEEAGLVGSKYFTENPLIDLKKIKFLLNMDIMGTGDEGIKVVNGAVYSNEFNRLVAINEEKQYLKSVQPRGKAANSDHYFFTEKGVPAFFIYTLGGIAAYHDIYDKADTLPLTDFEDLFHLIIDFENSF